MIGALASSYVNAGNLGLPVAAYVLGDAAFVAPTLLLQLLVLQPTALAALDADVRGGGRRSRTSSFDRSPTPDHRHAHRPAALAHGVAPPDGGRRSDRAYRGHGGARDSWPTGSRSGWVRASVARCRRAS